MHSRILRVACDVATKGVATHRSITGLPRHTGQMVGAESPDGGK
jgi:hypothetical protein